MTSDYMPTTNQEYEIILAKKEIHFCQHYRDYAYYKSFNGQISDLYNLCQYNVMSQTIKGSAKEYFEDNQYKLGYATHGLYPYRGKFHPQMARHLLIF